MLSQRKFNYNLSINEAFSPTFVLRNDISTAQGKKLLIEVMKN